VRVRVKALVTTEAGKVYASEALSPTLSACGWAGD
jgi:hypothetical protein